ncbi:MAG: HNH endonuclease signature motif containing protein [Gammaproteobacteria bacterium]|nr:HNH endonuclease signature motif containing protein [Gammaproteobacteria bacterium]
MSVGRKTRSIPPHIRLALEQRDGGCRYPNCHQTRNVDGHHIISWLDGGETSLENLISLCRFHHTRLHRGDYRIETRDEQFVFITQRGRRLERVVPFTPHDPTQITREVEQRFRQQGLDITPATAVTKWEGETMDYRMALAALAQRERDGP